MLSPNYTRAKPLVNGKKLKVLIVTVGGSPQPIITSANTLKPDRIIFICSKGPKSSKSQVIGKGRPCRIPKEDGSIEELPNLPAVLNLGDRFDPTEDLIIIEPDDATECYRTISETILRFLKAGDEVMADYTGGTKTMSVSLAMAAMDYRIKLYLTTTTRKDLVQVRGGESTEMVSTSFINVERRVEQFLPLLLKQYNYSAAIDQLKELLHTFPLNGEAKRRLRKLINICSAFEAWDQFRHEDGWNLLESYMEDNILKHYGLYLKRVIQSRADIDCDFTTTHGIAGHGFEIVEDLVMNAERRAFQQRYDDAVGRLYRAIELLAQIYLYRHYNIRTGDIDISRLPIRLQPEYEKLQHLNNREKIQIGLKKSYQFLSEFENDPFKNVYESNEKQIDKILTTRNDSLFAHGFNPISKNLYESLSNEAVFFIKSALQTICPTGSKFEFMQFPDNLG